MRVAAELSSQLLMLLEFLYPRMSFGTIFKSWSMHSPMSCQCSGVIFAMVNDSSLSKIAPRIETKFIGTISDEMPFKSSTSSILFITSSVVSSGRPFIIVAAQNQLLSSRIPKACVTISCHFSAGEGNALPRMCFAISRALPVSIPVCAPCQSWSSMEWHVSETALSRQGLW